MKKPWYLALCLGFISLIFFHSCDITEVTKKYTYDLECDVKSSDSIFSTEMVLNPYEESGDFETVEDKMETAELVRVEYTVTYFNGPDSQKLNLAEWKIADTLGTDPKVLCSIIDAKLHSLTSEIRELPLNPEGVSKFNHMVEGSNYVFKIAFNGRTNSAPVDFRLKFYVTIKVTAHVI